MHHASTPRNATQLGVTFPESNLDRRRRTDGERDTVTAPAPPDTPTAWRLTVESHRHGEYNYATLSQFPWSNLIFANITNNKLFNYLLLCFLIFVQLWREIQILYLFFKSMKAVAAAAFLIVPGSGWTYGARADSWERVIKEIVNPMPPPPPQPSSLLPVYDINRLRHDSGER
jgi:hypothetical protein